MGPQAKKGEYPREEILPPGHFTSRSVRRLGIGVNMPKAIFLFALLAGCAVTGTASREEIAVNKFFDDRIAVETDEDLLIKHIEKTRAVALDLLGKATNSNVRHTVAVHILRTTPASINEMKTILHERRRCNELQTRLQEDEQNIHELVRTLAIAGCSQYIR